MFIYYTDSDGRPWNTSDFILEFVLLRCLQFFGRAFSIAWCAAAVLAVVLPLIYVWWRDHPCYGSNVGPKVFPLVGSLPAMLRNKHRILDWATEEIRKSPSLTIRNVIPPGQNFFDTANPTVVEHFLKDKFDIYQKGEACHDVFEDLLGNGIFNVDGELWRMQRKVVAQEFSTSSLRDLLLERVEKEMSHRLVPILERARLECRTVDLQVLFTRFGFDNICHLAFGMDPASLDPSLPTVPFEKAFDDAAVVCFSRFFTAPFVWKLRRALNIGSERRLRKSVKVIDEYAYSVIRARRAELALEEQQQGRDGSRHQDLLSRYILGSGGKQCTDAFLRDVVVSLLIAGKDSTPTVLCWLFWLLSCHPRVERGCYQEIARVLGASPGQAISSEHFSLTFTHEQLRGMHYLQAALSEVLRLYPSAPAGMRCAMQDDVLPDGIQVSKGAKVGFYSYAMGRMKSVWGEDCFEFRPERWLSPTGQFRPESPYKFTAFHAGPRMCPGRDAAFLQMKFIAAALIPRFTFQIAPGYVPKGHISLVMRLKHGLPVTVRPRDHSLMSDPCV